MILRQQLVPSEDEPEAGGLRQKYGQTQASLSRLGLIPNFLLPH